MFFVLAKILGFFALPSNILITLGLLGIVLMATRFARAGRRLAVIALILIAIAGYTPLGNALILPLEDRFRQALLFQMCAHALMRDQEDIQDARAAQFASAANTMLVGSPVRAPMPAQTRG